MKNYYLFYVVSLLSIHHVFGQNPTPNAGFENWTQAGNHFDPDGWNTLNPATSAVGVLTVTRATGADVHSGSYAMKLTTKLVFGLTANGIASTGTIITTPPYGVVGGLPITVRPDSIAGWYKCAPASGDTGFAQILLMDANGDTVAFTRWLAPAIAIGTYTRFSKAINYYNTNAVDTSQWMLSSSKGFNQVVNSTIIFDDIELITNPVGVPEFTHLLKVPVYPTISSGLFTFVNSTGKAVSLEIMDSQGKIVSKNEISESRHILNMENEAKGLYFYKVLDESKLIVYTGKIILN